MFAEKKQAVKKFVIENQLPIGILIGGLIVNGTQVLANKYLANQGFAMIRPHSVVDGKFVVEDIAGKLFEATFPTTE